MMLKNKKKLTIQLVGDISLTDNYDKLLKQNGPAYPFEKIGNQLRNCDLLIGNLESPLTRGGETFRYKTSLKGDPSYAETLKSLGFNFLNISNNHILDYKEEGVEETVKVLDKAGIGHFGYGKNRNEAIKMNIFHSNGISVGMVGYTDIDIDSPFWANVESRGIARYDSKTIKSEIERNKDKVDFLVVSLHWGIENFHLPSPLQRQIARDLIDFGADIVYGHHPHVVQGIERWKGGVIAYSLGNFVFSEIEWKWEAEKGEPRVTVFPLESENRKSFILKVLINDKSGLDYDIIGTYISNNGQVEVAPWVENNIQNISRILINIKNYDEYFKNKLKWFDRKNTIYCKLRRLKNIKNIRFKHFIEFKNLLRSVLRTIV